MRSTSPYLDTSFSFDSPGSLADAGVLDSGKAQIMGRATGHYRAQTVHAGLQYFDCNLQFPEPLQIDKLLPQSLCIVHVFDGAWQHKVDGTLNHYAPGHLHLLGLGESLEAQDQLPADSHARMAGVRIAGDYLHELARDDAQLLPLLALTADGMRFDQLPQCPAVSRLLQQLYLSPYTGGLRRLHCESLSVAVVLELARHLIGPAQGTKNPDRGLRDLAIEARRLLDTQLAPPPPPPALHANWAWVRPPCAGRSATNSAGLCCSTCASNAWSRPAPCCWKDAGRCRRWPTRSVMPTLPISAMPTRPISATRLAANSSFSQAKEKGLQCGPFRSTPERDHSHSIVAGGLLDTS